MRALASLLQKALHNECRIKDATGEHTSSDIEQLCSSIEKELVAFDPFPSEPVIISIGNRANDIAAFYAVWRMGLVAVPLHESAPRDVVAQMKRTVGARLIVGKGKVEGTGEKSSRLVPEDTALVIFTSGSTGRPKGVMLGHERLAAKISVLDELLKFATTDSVVVPLQLTFVFGIWASLLAMKSGATLVLKPKFSVSEMNYDLRAGTSVIAVVPTMLRTIPLDAPIEGIRLRQILTGGEPFIAALAEKVRAAFPHAEIFDLYGSTETGSCDFYLNVADSSEQGTIGRPTARVSYRIVSEDGHDCGINEAGELRIHSPFAMLGYFGDRATTDAAFDEKQYFRTGDIACELNNGLVQLAGRKKEIVSRGGIKISPVEVDSVFSKHPDVAAALCGGVPDARLGEALHILIVRRDGVKLEAQELMNWAATKIEKTKLPNEIHFVEALPLGRTGKADRASIKLIVRN